MKVVRQCDDVFFVLLDAVPVLVVCLDAGIRMFLGGMVNSAIRFIDVSRPASTAVPIALRDCRPQVAVIEGTSASRQTVDWRDPSARVDGERLRIADATPTQSGGYTRLNRASA